MHHNSKVSFKKNVHGTLLIKQSLREKGSSPPTILYVESTLREKPISRQKEISICMDTE